MREIQLTLDQVVLRAREFTKSNRKILGITGAPGAGKSTVAKAIIAERGELAAFAPRDGFHLSNATLIAQGKRERKGAIDTFDAAGYANLLERLRKDGFPAIDVEIPGRPGVRRVLVGPLADSKIAAMRAELERKGLQGNAAIPRIF